MSEMAEMDTGKTSPEVIRIAEQAKEISNKKNGKRADTLFYKVVLGGNLTVTSQVVSYMEHNDMTETLNWLSKRNHFEDKKHIKAKASRKLLLTRVAVFVFFSAISTLLTPIFYAVHILTNAFFNGKHKRISADIRLPLAFAAFSKDEEMLQYFLSLGVDVENIDEEGNNVFHYIADLSSVAADNACKIFSATVKFINDTDAVQDLLIKNKNSAGHTAMEYAVKFGSPILQMQILKQPNLLRHTAFAVGKHEVRFDDNLESEQHPTSLPDVSTHLEYVDVTMYEAGSLADQSTVLNLLSDRNVDKMSREDLQIFNPATFFGTWINLKISQLVPGVAIMHTVDFIVTIVLLLIIYTADTGKSGNTYRQWRGQQEWDAKMAEVGHLADTGFSSVLKADAYNRAIEEQQRQLQLEFLPDLIDDSVKKQLLFNATIEKFPNVREYYNDSVVNWNVTARDIPYWVTDAFYKSAFEDELFKDNGTLLYVALNFRNITKDYAQQIHKEHIEKKDDITMVTWWGSRTLCGSVYDNFTITYNNNNNSNVIVPREFFPCYFFSEALCISGKYFNSSDILLSNMHEQIVDAGEHLYTTTCAYIMLIDLASSETKCGSYQSSALMKILYSDPYEFLIDIAASDKFIHIMACCYISLDIIERCVFMFMCVSKQSSVLQMFVTALSHKVPGSYARKQMNVSTYLGILFTFIINQIPHDSYIYNHIQITQVWIMYGLINILCAIFRFIMHIHSLRLLPGIGHFVITTFMMGTNLIHFSTVFGIVLFIFSVLFHILIDDQSCPIEKAAGFETIQASMFSTFKLTFGHGDFEPFYSTTPVKVAYTLYVVIVGLLLMNLIIAIMSTTATEIMADPWRDALWKVEWLDEATSAEYTFSIIGLPFRTFTNVNLFLHEKVGYVVKKVNDKRSKVYVEVFHCPATE